MPRYRLLAARDGKITEKVEEWPNDEIAKAWAAGTCALAFDLDTHEYDTIEKIFPETDGCRLEELEADPVWSAAAALITVLQPRLAKAASTPLHTQDCDEVSIVERTAKLALALRQVGYVTGQQGEPV